jgi:ABC-type dipeptide/oligopeptide/nickel transport system ATPase component
VPHPGQIASGEVLFDGERLLQKSSADMRRIRGKEIAMIFQDPLTTLNPVLPIGEQIHESLRIHNVIDAPDGGWHPLGRRRRRKAEQARVLDVMHDVGIPSPADRVKAYPHQFSGGMQQRAIIAIALSCEPRLLLADEPTTALDVTIQAQIMALLNRINKTRVRALSGHPTWGCGVLRKHHRHVRRLDDGGSVDR